MEYWECISMYLYTFKLDLSRSILCGSLEDIKVHIKSYNVHSYGLIEEERYMSFIHNIDGQYILVKMTSKIVKHFKLNELDPEKYLIFISEDLINKDKFLLIPVNIITTDGLN